MRIHVYCHRFPPDIGGMERLLHTLCGEFVAQGHTVEVVTETVGRIEAPYPIHSAPSAGAYREIVRRSDVILSAPLALRRLGSQLASGKPVCVAHPLVPLIVYPGVPFRAWWRRSVPHAVKRLASFLVTNIVPSSPMARSFPSSIVINNPFDKAIFHQRGDEPRKRDILFVGRLIYEKGCDILLEAFRQIASDHLEVNLTIVGDGPVRPELDHWVLQHGLQRRVTFLGSLPASQVALQMRRHLMMAVPSLWDEPFGIVALEGMACGCRIVAARVGGLPEAVGDNGLLFERADAAGLAQCLRQVLDDDWQPDPRNVSRHLDQHSPAAIARQYLDVLGCAARQGPTALGA